MLAVGLQAQMNTSLVCPSSVVTWLAAICSPLTAPLVSGRAVSVPFATAPLRTVCPFVKPRPSATQQEPFWQATFAALPTDLCGDAKLWREQ